MQTSSVVVNESEAQLVVWAKLRDRLMMNVKVQNMTLWSHIVRWEKISERCLSRRSKKVDEALISAANSGRICEEGDLWVAEVVGMMTGRGERCEGESKAMKRSKVWKGRHGRSSAVIAVGWKARWLAQADTFC